MQKSDGRLESEAVVAEKGDVLPAHTGFNRQYAIATVTATTE